MNKPTADESLVPPQFLAASARMRHPNCMIRSFGRSPASTVQSLPVKGHQVPACTHYHQKTGVVPQPVLQIPFALSFSSAHEYT